MNLKNYEKTLTVKGFDVRLKGGFVRLKDLKKVASSLGYNTDGKSPKSFFESEEGSKWVEVTGPEHFKGKFASDFIALKYSEYIDVGFLVKVHCALDIYRKSAALRNLAAEAHSSMREALWAAGGDWMDLVNECDYITSLVLGCTAYGFTVANNLPEECSYIDYLTDTQLAEIVMLTRINTTLIEEGAPFSKRRNKLKSVM